VIDVNASRTTRLLDGPTPAMMNAAAARIEPGDVLPRPANEVQSLDEFGRISEGLYPGVRAPRERDVLETRQFPSRANPDNMLNRRGPLDLAAFVRAEGGVADFRGELKAAGLSNAPRKGDDFAGGENRLGPLLDDERGASLDDMAQRAWEAGYFPDHATRPTVDEFVTALGDTYRGVNRTFRPDDFAEIDAFNAARDQRLAVERARQEGIVTGSRPSDDNQYRLKMAGGWQPYSIKIGDTYYSYRRLDPFAMTIGTAADLATMGDGMTDKQRDKGAALWTASLIANLASRTRWVGADDEAATANLGRGQRAISHQVIDGRTTEARTGNSRVDSFGSRGDSRHGHLSTILHEDVQEWILRCPKLTSLPMPTFFREVGAVGLRIAKTTTGKL
jgi:hypothetical protein